MALRFLGAKAVREEVSELISRFENRSGTEVEALFDLNPVIASRIAMGEEFDIGATNPWHVPELIKLKRVISDSHLPFGRVQLGIGVLEQRRSRTCTRPEEIARLLAMADSVAYTVEGTSGQAFLNVVERLNLPADFYSRAKPMGSGEPLKAVLCGKVEMCAAPMTLILASVGIAPAAVIPTELGGAIDISLFLAEAARFNSDAKKLIEYLVSDEARLFLTDRGVSAYQL